jgi:hypothetical protein
MKVSLIIGAIAAAAGAIFFKVQGGAFAGVIPGIIIGFLCTFVGIAVKWIAIHLMGATTGDWRDKLFGILLPFLCAGIGGYAGANFIAGLLAK